MISRDFREPVKRSPGKRSLSQWKSEREHCHVKEKEGGNLPTDLEDGEIDR